MSARVAPADPEVSLKIWKNNNVLTDKFLDDQATRTSNVAQHIERLDVLENRNYRCSGRKWCCIFIIAAGITIPVMLKQYGVF